MFWSWSAGVMFVFEIVEKNVCLFASYSSMIDDEF